MSLVNEKRLWEEIEWSQVHLGDFLYITWNPREGGKVAAAPSMGEVVGYDEKLLYLQYEEEILKVSVVEYNMTPVVMRKT